MGSENLELVRRAWDRWNATGEVPLEFLHPEIEWGTLLESYRGHDGVERWQRELREMIGDFTIELGDAVAVGDKVVAIASISGRGQITGIEGKVEFAAVLSLLDGRIARLDPYQTRAEAMRAAGQGEDPAS